MYRWVQAVVVGVSVAVIPAAAYAVGVSSNDGSGSQSVTKEYNNGWEASGTLRSTSGDRVYFSGRVVYNFYSDAYCGRYTRNTSDTSGVSRGGSCSHIPYPGPSADGARFQVCRDRRYRPDPCGSWSSEDSF
ncbi:MAG: hypothetical protein ACRCYU_06230 [Nocardioides sp.]